MLLYFIRHGDPTYQPNRLTPLGRRQAESVGRRLSIHGIDKIYSSDSQRAMETAQPLAEILKKEIVLLPWANEDLAWQVLAPENPELGRKVWAFGDERFLPLFNSREVRALGDKWYTHPAFAQYPSFETGIERIRREADSLLLELGYRHDRENCCYEAVRPNEDRVALFAHQGFGLAFLSQVLDIPYPQFSTLFDMGHTGMTVLEFANKPGPVFPRADQVASDGHLYRDGLPTKYQNRVFL